MARSKQKTLKEKAADFVDHVLHPNADENGESKDDTGSSDDDQASAVIDDQPKQVNDDHPKFQKFK